MIYKRKKRFSLNLLGSTDHLGTYVNMREFFAFQYISRIGLGVFNATNKKEAERVIFITQFDTHKTQYEKIRTYSKMSTSSWTILLGL